MIAHYVAPGGRFALSGILANQANDIIAAYEAEGLHVKAPEEREGWVRIDGYRPD